MQRIFRFHCLRERCATYFRIDIMSWNEKNIGTMQTNINFVQVVTRTSVHLHADRFRFIKRVVVLQKNATFEMYQYRTGDDEMTRNAFYTFLFEAYEYLCMYIDLYIS